MYLNLLLGKCALTTKYANKLTIFSLFSRPYQNPNHFRLAITLGEKGEIIELITELFQKTNQSKQPTNQPTPFYSAWSYITTG